MHSFRQSRTRILFEVFCALAISASCVGAWMQTGASALLSAAAVSALYGLVHAFDMVGRRTAVAVEPQRIDFATDDQGDLLASRKCRRAAGGGRKAAGYGQGHRAGGTRRGSPKKRKSPGQGSPQGRRPPRQRPQGRGGDPVAPLEEAKIASIHPEVAERRFAHRSRRGGAAAYRGTVRAGSIRQDAAPGVWT